MTSDSTSTMTRTGKTLLVVERKLPDDLRVEEFARLTSAAGQLCESAAWLDSPGATDLYGYKPVIALAAYGSPLTLAITVPAAVLTALVALTKAVKQISETAKNFAEAQNFICQEQLNEAETLRTLAEMDLIDSQIDKTGAETRLIEAQTRNMDAQTDVLRLDYEARKRALTDGTVAGRTSEILRTQLMSVDEGRAADKVNRVMHAQFSEKEDARELLKLQHSVNTLAPWDPNFRFERGV